VKNSLFSGHPAFDHHRDGSQYTVQDYYNLKHDGYLVNIVDAPTDTLYGISAHKKDDETVHLRRLGVNKQKQDSGIGKALFDKILTDTTKWRCKKIMLQAHSGVVEYWQQLGFNVVRTYSDDHWNGSCYEMILYI
jgi:N-acetylglutamate synthase-like GNAT family acetyltransferase